MTIKLTAPCPLLTLAFLVLKLTGVIAWSWWWVFSPIWVPIALLLAFAAVILTVAMVICFAFVVYLLWNVAP